MVRNTVQDRDPGDNTIDCDLFFSDEEILHAMDQCAAAYNAISPLGVDVVHGRALPAGTEVFMDGVCARLYKAGRQKLARNLMNWSTGNTTVELEKSRMEAFSLLQKELEASFKEGAKERKMEMNRSLSWGMY